jgi:hypothetical protein
MNDEELDNLERQLASLHLPIAPLELRGFILADARHELQAARWDRRLARAAAVLLVVGVGLNLSIGLPSTSGTTVQERPVARSGAQQALLDTAIVVAEATDAATGGRFARQFAAMSGRALTDVEAAEIDAAIKRASTHGSINGNEG